MAQKTKRFVVTEKGQKTGILLSLKEYRSLIEDLRDLAIIAERKDEPSEPRVPPLQSRKLVETASSYQHPIVAKYTVKY